MKTNGNASPFLKFSLYVFQKVNKSALESQHLKLKGETIYTIDYRPSLQQSDNAQVQHEFVYLLP